MANTIALSTDMQTIYQISDGGDVTSFDLTTTNGVIIETVSGDVQISNATTPLTQNLVTLGTGTTAQWQVAFHPNNTTAVFIGSGDIEVGRSSKKTFSISGTNQVNLKHSSNELTITTN